MAALVEMFSSTGGAGMRSRCVHEVVQSGNAAAAPGWRRAFSTSPSKAGLPSRFCAWGPRGDVSGACSLSSSRASSHLSALSKRSSAASCASRSFSSSCRWQYKTVQEAKSRYKSGPFSWKSGLLFLLSGAGMVVYFRYEKGRMERKRIAEATKGMGRPKVGGPFELVDQDGRPFSSEDMKGKYALVYFGFTHCPDICPEELDKMAGMIDLVRERAGDVMRPIFITCDPARDTSPVVKTYLSEFHREMIGLTGSWDDIKAVCKAYRVYFSTPPGVQQGQDYLVDHSIYFYLLDPEGDFVEAIGRQHTPEQAAKIITSHVGDWKGRIDRS